MLNPDVQRRNETFINALRSSGDLQKKASNGLNDFLRKRAYEDGIYRQVLPPQDITPADLDRSHDTIKPQVVIDIEPNIDSAYSMPFGGVPYDNYMGANRYRIMFDRLETQRYTEDVANLLTWDMDIRSIWNDLLLQTILEREDTVGFAVTDTIVGAKSDDTTDHYADTESYGWTDVGNFSRASIRRALSGIPAAKNSLNTTRAIVNNLTILKVLDFGRDAVGGDLSEEMFVNGLSETTFMGTKWISTIKKDIVANDVAYMFAAPKFLGNFLVLEDVTVSTKVENYHLETFAYELIGSGIFNAGGAAKASFEGSYTGWTS